MKPASWKWLLWLLLLATLPSLTKAASGLPTRDLNPIFQSIYLPSYHNLNIESGWRVDHNLFITNTFQQQSTVNESLIIDVENTRYELGLGYRQANWVFQAKLPLISNSGGVLDGLIENWHDAFGLSQGGRTNLPRDQINIEYQRNSVVEYSQTSSSSGIGDLSLALGYQPPGEIGYFIAIDLPTGSESEFTSNNRADIALWLIGHTRYLENWSLYGLLGISFPADAGPMKELLVDKIWLAQTGLEYRFNQNMRAIAQLDMHSKTLSDSQLKAFGQSLQIQLGLGFDQLIPNHRLTIFFSEDIDVGSAPDITFSIALTRHFD